MADPQVMTWYPPAFLLSLVPGTWNVFMLLAYVAGSSFMYGYIYTLTKSRFAALISGLIYGMSGFMIAHLGHAVIVHAAAWIPLIIWALEMQRQKLTAKWLIIGSLALTLSFLGGHSQIFFYGLIVSIAYALALGWSAPAGRWGYYFSAALMMILGVSLAAVQIIPTAELVRQGGRVGYSFQDFVSHSLPPRQALTMIFPAVFGGVREPGASTYFGVVNQTELSGYLGLLPLILAAVGIVAARRRPIPVFWLCVGVLAFFLVMGDATALARLIYHVPVLDSFRAPARHFIELTLAISALSGLGVAAIIRGEVSISLMRRVLIITILSMLACLVLLFLNKSYMSALATQKEVFHLSLLPWTNRAVGIPLLVFFLGIAVLAYWHRRPTSGSRKALLLIMLVIDLGSFGWFFEWRYGSPDKNALNAPERAIRYRNLFDASNQRLTPYRSSRGTIAEMPPNLTRLWGVPSASGYNVLIFSRITNLLPMIDYIDVPLPWSEPRNTNLDIMAVRYLFLPQDQPTTDERGMAWLKQDAQYWLGHACTQPENKTAVLTLPQPVPSTALAIVSRLACSSQITDGAEVARLQLFDSHDNVQTRTIVAGRDASEWAIDCPGVKPYMRHGRSKIFSSYPANMYGEPCEGHFYLTTLDLGGVKDIKSIHFDWINGPGTIIIEKLTLLNEVTHGSYPIDLALMDSNAWRLIEATESSRVYENLRAMPRAWLTPYVISVNADEALNAIKIGTLKDGRPFDPHQTALVEEPLTLTASEGDRGASAIITGLWNTRMEVRTSSKAAAFLVTSDAYYPGWHASIDGRETQLYRADYAIRGVVVPPGEHAVRFEYRPRAFYYGAVISAFSLLILGAIAFRATRFYRHREGWNSD